MLYNIEASDPERKKKKEGFHAGGVCLFFFPVLWGENPSPIGKPYKRIAIQEHAW